MSGAPRLTLVISSLRMGGAERVMSLLAAGWSRQGVEVSLITLDGADSDFYPLDKGVSRIALDVMSASSNPAAALGKNFSRIKALRNAIKETRPQAVVSFMDKTNVLTLLAARSLGVPVIVSDRIDLRYPVGWFWGKLRRRTYNRAAAVVAVTGVVAGQLGLFVEKPPVIVIPNPVEETGCTGEAELELDRPAVIALGRLVPRKRFDLLIRAFARAAEAWPDWVLVILGEGPERPALEELGRKLGLGGRLWLPGAVKRPGPVLAQAEIFALCSAYEGFPNSLLEAMSCGVPVVAVNQAGGLEEVVRQEVDGLLLPDADERALAGALVGFMDREDVRAEMGNRALEVHRRFGLPAVLGRWNRLLSEVSGRPWP